MATVGPVSTGAVRAGWRVGQSGRRLACTAGGASARSNGRSETNRRGCSVAVAETGFSVRAAHLGGSVRAICSTRRGCAVLGAGCLLGGCLSTISGLPGVVAGAHRGRPCCLLLENSMPPTEGDQEYGRNVHDVLSLFRAMTVYDVLSPDTY